VRQCQGARQNFFLFCCLSRTQASAAQHFLFDPSLPCGACSVLFFFCCRSRGQQGLCVPVFFVFFLFFVLLCMQKLFHFSLSCLFARADFSWSLLLSPRTMLQPFSLCSVISPCMRVRGISDIFFVQSLPAAARTVFFCHTLLQCA
jgi:hypothetical protein